MTIAYETDFNKLAKSIHADNVKAGWWTDIKTGESITPAWKNKDPSDYIHRRNPGELLALVHSEISEAIEVDIFCAKDSHLTKYDGVFVEIADAAIRIFDIAGAYGFNFTNMKIGDLSEAESDIYYIYAPALNIVHVWISRALEGFRKSKMCDVEHNLNLAIINLREVYNNRLKLWEEINAFTAPNLPDFFKMIQLKREYNLQRADHKIENRLKDDGKKI